MTTNKSFSTETSERYARALFEVSTELNELKKIENDTKNFQSLLEASSELQNFIKNPTQNISQQNKVIDLISKKIEFFNKLKKLFFTIN